MLSITGINNGMHLQKKNKQQPFKLNFWMILYNFGIGLSLLP